MTGTSRLRYKSHLLLWKAEPGRSLKFEGSQVYTETLSGKMGGQGRDCFLTQGYIEKLLCGKMGGGVQRGNCFLISVCLWYFVLPDNVLEMILWTLKSYTLVLKLFCARGC